MTDFEQIALVLLCFNTLGILLILYKNKPIHDMLRLKGNREIPQDVLDRITFLEEELEDAYTKMYKLFEKKAEGKNDGNV
jgi:hypothetical protein